LNVVWIGTLLWIRPRFGDTAGEQIYGIAWGILVAGLIQLAVQLPVLMRFGYRPALSFAWRDARLSRVMRLMAPAALGMGVIQINAVIDSVLALIVGEWAPAALSFAELMVYMPLGIFATALGTVLLPTLSRQAANADHDAMKQTLNLGIRLVLLIAVPAAVGLVVLARPLIQMLFEWRAFGEASTEQTARALAFFAPGLVAFGFYKVLVPAFYAAKDTRSPVRVALWVVGLNLVLNITFILTWPEGYRHAGLAFATVLASAVNGIVLAGMLHRRIGSPGWRMLSGRAVRIVLVSGVMGAAAHWLYAWFRPLAASWMPTPKAAQIVAVIGTIVLCVAAYAGLAALVCPAEVRGIAAAFRQRRRRDNPQ
jgi:putative peptidoglycan lipid II flippase